MQNRDTQIQKKSRYVFALDEQTYNKLSLLKAALEEAAIEKISVTVMVDGLLMYISEKIQNEEEFNNLLTAVKKAKFKRSKKKKQEINLQQLVEILKK